MTDALADLRDLLRDRDTEFRRLEAEHREHDLRLTDLRSRHFLTEEEKLEEVTLKKRKLFLKDQMARIAKRYREKVGT